MRPIGSSRRWVRKGWSPPVTSSMAAMAGAICGRSQPSAPRIRTETSGPVPWHADADEIRLLVTLLGGQLADGFEQVEDLDRIGLILIGNGLQHLRVEFLQFRGRFDLAARRMLANQGGCLAKEALVDDKAPVVTVPHQLVHRRQIAIRRREAKSCRLHAARRARPSPPQAILWKSSTLFCGVTATPSARSRAICLRPTDPSGSCASSN
jgi:hypothetical protein